QMPANMHEIQNISIRPVGKMEECKKHIQLIKRDENKEARQQVKEERKQIKKSMQNWYASREKQIYNTLVRIMDLHKHMGDARKSVEIETAKQSRPRPRNQTHTPTSRGNQLEMMHVSTEEPEAHETTQPAPTSRNKRKRPDTQEQELESQPNLAHDSLPQTDLDDPAHVNEATAHEPVSAPTPRKTKRQNTSSAPRPHPGNPRNKRKTPDTQGQVLEPSHTPSGPVRNGMQDSPANSVQDTPNVTVDLIARTPTPTSRKPKRKHTTTKTKPKLKPCRKVRSTYGAREVSFMANWIKGNRDHDNHAFDPG
ncbi:MAG TPA: hypothetical protein V6C97_00960, partial [Oculatellaceae cyanobacterium]